MLRREPQFANKKALADMNGYSRSKMESRYSSKEIVSNTEDVQLL